MFLTVVPLKTLAGVGCFTSSPIELWDQTIDTNVKAAMRLTKFALPHLEASAKVKRLAAVINIASVSGTNYYGGLAPCTSSMVC